MREVIRRRSSTGFALIIAISFIALGCGPTEDSPPAPAVAPVPAPASPEAQLSRIRITVLGDSLAAGFGLAESQAFPAILEQELRRAGHPVEVLNAGVSGDTTAGGLARLDWVLRSRPDLLVVELGGNDALRGQPLESTERNLREILRRARAAGVRLLLLGMDIPTNFGQDYTSRFAQIYERIAEDEQVALLPGFVREIGLDENLMMSDGLHPTADGHRRLAEDLAAALEPLLPPTTP